MLVHGGVRDVQQYMKTPAIIAQNAAWLREDFPGARICFFGHSHEQKVYEVDGDTVTDLPFKKVFSLKKEKTYFINAGSVDASRKRTQKLAECAFFDSAALALRFERVAYDDAATEAKAERAGYRIDRGQLKTAIGMTVPPLRMRYTVRNQVRQVECELFAQMVKPLGITVQVVPADGTVAVGDSDAAPMPAEAGETGADEQVDEAEVAAEPDETDKAPPPPDEAGDSEPDEPAPETAEPASDKAEPAPETAESVPESAAERSRRVHRSGRRDHVERHDVRVILGRRRLMTEHARRRRRHRGDSQANTEYAAAGALGVWPECEHVVGVR